MIDSQKMDVLCPECNKKNEVLWFPDRTRFYKITGPTGHPTTKRDSNREKVLGNCSECNYKFKPDDLD